MNQIASSTTLSVQPSAIGDREQARRRALTSLITQGYAILRVERNTQALLWATLDSIDEVSAEQRVEFSFPDRTDGFLPIGGEHAKYTDYIDLCDRFCFWNKYRSTHENIDFAQSDFYQNIAECEDVLSTLASDLISGIWSFFQHPEHIKIRDHSYVQLNVYGNSQQENDREYLQDRHEDGHLITLIKPTRDGLVIFPNDVKTKVRLADDEIIVITGSLLTHLSDGQIPPMYHAVENPMMQVSRKSLVYFAIPDLTKSYTSLLAKSAVNLASLADESHRAFGNTSLV